MRTMGTAKRRILGLLVLSLTLSYIIGIYVIRDYKSDAYVSSSTPRASLSTLPQSFSTEIGETFQANITIENVHDLCVWQTGVSFNATVLEALVFEEGPFLRQQGATLWTPGTIDNTEGIIHYSASALIGNTLGVDGNGTLGIVTFRVKNYGNSSIQLTDVLVLNSRLNDIPKIVENLTIRIRIPGDVNNDGIVDVFDAAAISAHWYPGPPIGPLGYDPDFDVNSDGEINVFDASIVSAYWTGPPRGPKAP